MRSRTLTLKVLITFLQLAYFLSFDIQSGMGFSSDMGSVAPTVCYKPLTTKKGNQSSVLKFDLSSDSLSIFNSFEVSSKMKGGVDAFAANAEAKYFESLQEDSYSFTVNYFMKVSQKVQMTYSYDPANILTASGNNLYKNGDNLMFRLFCGDYLLRSFTEGAGLIFSYKLHFKSKEEKTQFVASAGMSYGGFVEASTTVEQNSKKLGVRGSISVNAYQFGGDPTQLTKILSSSVVNCDIKNIEACKATAAAMIKYSSEDFPTQFKKGKDNIWETPLIALGQVEKDFLVSDFGLKLAKSYLTEELKKARIDLIGKFKITNYYRQSMADFKSNYPLAMSESFNRLLSTVNEQTNILQTGEDTFKYPNRGIEVYNEILPNVDVDIEKKVLAEMEAYRYRLTYPNIDLTNRRCADLPYPNDTPPTYGFELLPSSDGKNASVRLIKDSGHTKDYITPVSNTDFDFGISFYVGPQLIRANIQVRNKGNNQADQTCNGRTVSTNSEQSANPYYFDKYRY